MKPMTPEEIAEVRQTHVECNLDGPACGACGDYWPCDATRLLATLDAREEEIARLKRRLSWRDDDPGATHYEGCHEEHRSCAMRRIARMQDVLRRMVALYDPGRDERGQRHAVITEAEALLAGHAPPPPAKPCWCPRHLAERAQEESHG